MTLDRRALIAAGLAASGSAWAAPAVARAAPLPPVPGEMVLGSPTAPVQLVAYASASCPHCAHWWTEVLPQVRKSFVDTGKVRFVFREFLTPPTEFAAAGFILARRIPGKYFEVLSTVFQRQEEIYRSEKLWEGLQAIGKQYGLTDAQFAAAMNDPAALKGVNDRFFRALNQENIEVTPTFFVNGAPIEGDTGFDALAKAFAVAAKG
ncbi:thiol:disulfide interchange protein [Caulobacter segnis]|uniref:Thiol:disulfide interchange protein DsbA n=2 Tax=Caulobacter segnis TaxID=88688 RepID=D5VE45_CAUST|nr:thioredoxin domain-containing protein [Caulobacter segnis]ADG08868.1 thiol:disulfide interchange protein DsbA [Caulobacter segnis ATCC 21756]AVQ00709.1 thiol:disulfide interchange protein [Caulobacter segnis]